MFRILYMFGQPPYWMGYVQFAVMVGLMGLVYLQVTRRRMGFMLMFAVMIGIFFVDVLAYLPFAAYLVIRSRRRPAVVDQGG